MDINQRYELLGEKLLDRRQELKGAVDKTRSYLEDLQDVLQWLDAKEHTIPSLEDLPKQEEAARQQLTEHQQFHAELLGKEAVVKALRSKAQDLLQHKEDAEGMKNAKRQLKRLGEL